MLDGWSPRGGWIAYARDTESAVLGPTMDVWLVRPDGSRRHRVYDVADGLKDGPAVSWSPNGRYLAFTTDHFAAADPRLGVIDTRTGKLRRIRRSEQ
jgi:Tol biopolymer transport system component